MGVIDIYIVPLPHSRRLPCIKIVIEVFRKGQKKANTPETQRKYAKASINGSLSPFLGRPLFLFDSNHQRLEKEYGLWALLRHPNVLPLFGLLDHPAIPSTGIMAPRCTLGNLRVLACLRRAFVLCGMCLLFALCL